MKKLITLTFVLALVAIQFKNVTAATSKDIVGSWKYEAINAPEGYNKGTLIFTEKEGKLVGEVKFADGYKIEMKEVKIEESGTVKCGLYVDNNYINVTLKIDGSKMTGTVTTPDGDLKLNAQKEIK